EMPGLRAVEPEIIRRLSAIEEAADLGPDDVGDPVHVLIARLRASTDSRRESLSQKLGVTVISDKTRDAALQVLFPPANLSTMTARRGAGCSGAMIRKG